MVRLALIASVIVATCAQLVSAEDWPRWRGPRGDGTWHGPKLREEWPQEGLAKVWEQPCGGGYAGVTVADGRVYLFDRVNEPAEQERVRCFDAASGEPLWTHAYDVAYGDLDYGTGPRAAPTVHEGRVYTLGAVGHLRCLDAQSGEIVWSTNLQEDHGGKLSTWGYAASPLIYGGTVIVQPGAANGIMALDQKTGARVWGSLADEPGYATPILIEHNGAPQVIHWSPMNVHGVDPRDGKSLWSIPYEVTYGVSIATPIFVDDVVLVCGYWEGSKAIQLGKTPQEAALLWEENRYLRGLMSQPLYRDGHVYLLDKQYGLTCFPLRTGEKLWDDSNTLTPRGRNPQASFVWIGDEDKVLALNADGELVLARINPAGYHELARSKIIGETWAHPAYAGTRIYARSDEKLVCFELPVEGS